MSREETAAAWEEKEEEEASRLVFSGLSPNPKHKSTHFPLRLQTAFCGGSWGELTVNADHCKGTSRLLHSVSRHYSGLLGIACCAGHLDNQHYRQHRIQQHTFILRISQFASFACYNVFLQSRMRTTPESMDG